MSEVGIDRVQACFRERKTKKSLRERLDWSGVQILLGEFEAATVEELELLRQDEWLMNLSGDSSRFVLVASHECDDEVYYFADPSERGRMETVEMGRNAYPICITHFDFKAAVAEIMAFCKGTDPSRWVDGESCWIRDSDL